MVTAWLACVLLRLPLLKNIITNLPKPCLLHSRPKQQAVTGCSPAAAVDIGPAHWIWLNSYFTSDSNSAQYKFLVNDLKSYASLNRNGTDGPTP